MFFRKFAQSLSLMSVAFVVLGVPAAPVSAQPDPALYSGMQWRMIGPFRIGRTVTVSGVPSEPNVYYMAPSNGGVWVAFDPANAQMVFAVLWAERHAPSTGESALEDVTGSGLFKSTHGGSTWKQIGQGLPTVAQGLGRIGIGIAPSDPDRIYAQVEAPPESGGTYRRPDSRNNSSWRCRGFTT